ncbi:MAG: hypothetical protein M3383_08575 [Actinomycetota bacterium]|nr:hypothetical protein [Actinomycetota bacterium]
MSGREAGEWAGPATNDLAAILRPLAERLRAAPQDEARARQLDAIVLASRLATSDEAIHRHTRLAAPQLMRDPRAHLAAKVVGVAIAVPITSVALAVAGVRLPEPVEAAFEAIGVALPNQADDVETGHSRKPETGRDARGRPAEHGADSQAPDSQGTTRSSGSVDEPTSRRGAAGDPSPDTPSSGSGQTPGGPSPSEPPPDTPGGLYPDASDGPRGDLPGGGGADRTFIDPSSSQGAPRDLDELKSETGNWRAQNGQAGK